MIKNLPTSQILLAEKPGCSSYWRKMGGGSLFISLVVHGIFVAVALVWVFTIIPPPPEPDVVFKPKISGGASASNVKTQNLQVMNIPKPSQVIATGVAGGISLPDPEISGLGSSLSSLSSSSLTSGSTGGGGNFGATNANISLPSALSNSNGFTNPFGETKVNENALVGKFYDLKQNSKREPLESSSDITRKVIQEFVNNGWRDKTLEDYFSPRQNLYLSKLYIPKIAATEAPAAFGCEKEVKPSQIMMRYTGTVRAPESGNYRFVGAADDILIVRFNNKNVFDHGYSIATAGKSTNKALLEGDLKDRELEKLSKILR